ncbi:MAG TPA: adenosylcobinamide-GDP ribazoletransferase [Kineosporiaceae bacterium]|nr:adenosylcobinamide-GDP ribazoletransferase [Kineosporiaceae bacterium]
MRDAFRLAVGTLTATRVPAPDSVAPPVPGQAMALAPLVGLIPGTAAAAAAWLAIVLGLWSGLTAVLVVGMFALTTRGLHLDGLADTADGLAASYDRDKALAVMRRGDTGPAGLATVVLVLLLQTAALTQVLAAVQPRFGTGPQFTVRTVAVVVLVAVAARVAIPLVCRQGIPAARPEGLGATVAGSVSVSLCSAVIVTAAVGCSLLGLASGLDWWAGPWAVATVAVATALLVRRAISRFAGITGDVIGAAVEIGTTAALLALAATTG